MILNPYKTRSKVNPQREKGDRRIANDVFVALIKAPISASEYKVCLHVINMTWGWGKHAQPISVAEFIVATELSDSGVHKAIVGLLEKRIIFAGPSKEIVRGSPINAYGFNKHFDTWRFAKAPF